MPCVATYAFVPLTTRDGPPSGFTLVDHATYVGLGGRRLSKTKQGYAQTGAAQLLHRLILELQPGDKRQTDHINRDRLDNRRFNLRVVTNRQNAQNQGARTDHGRGVVFNKANNNWNAAVTLDGRAHHLGCFDTAEEAASAAAAFRAERMPFSEEAG